MTEKEMWKAFCKESGNDTDNYEAWAFGDDADRLASLVLEGKKSATASVYELYEYDNEELPEVGDLSIILDSEDRAVQAVHRHRKGEGPGYERAHIATSRPAHGQGGARRTGNPYGRPGSRH